VLRRSQTNWSFKSLISMFCLATPLSSLPTTSFFHDFSGYAFTTVDRTLLGYGVNFAVTPTHAFNEDSLFGWKADFNRFKRSLHRMDYFLQSDGDSNPPPEPGEYAPDVALHVPSDWDPAVDDDDYVPTEQLTVFFEELEREISWRIKHCPRPVPNLPKRHRERLAELQREHDLVFIVTDKNLGLACDTRAAYISHCLDALSETHEVVDVSLDDCVLRVRSEFRDELIRFTGDDPSDGDAIPCAIPAWMSKFLFESFHRIPTSGGAYRVPKFYLLYKVHKAELGFRPITGNWCSPSQPASRLLAYILEPLVRDTTTYVRDADDLTCRLQGVHVGPRDVLVTYDVVNLYPSIPHDLCLDMVKQRLQRDWDANAPTLDRTVPVNFIMTMLRLVLSQNFCQFSGVVYRQLIGYATGTACGGQVAHIYLEEILGPVLQRFSEWLALHVRYIDDGFFIWSGTAARLSELIHAIGHAHPAVRITYAASASSAIFLDLRLYRDTVGALQLDVFQKAMNRYLYPLWRSEIPRTCLAGIAIGEIIRYIKRCSTHAAFVRMVNLLSSRLAARGWPRWFITKAYARAPLYSARDELLARTARDEPRGPADFAAALDATATPDAQRTRTHALILDYSAAACNLRLDRVVRRLAELLPAPLRAADFIVAWRAARKLGGAIRYRVDAVDGNDDNDNNDITPPLASPASDGEECEEEAEATQDGGGVFLDRDANPDRFRLSQLAPGDGSAFGSSGIAPADRSFDSEPVAQQSLSHDIR